MSFLKKFITSVKPSFLSQFSSGLMPVGDTPNERKFYADLNNYRMMCWDFGNGKVPKVVFTEFVEKLLYRYRNDKTALGVIEKVGMLVLHAMKHVTDKERNRMETANGMGQ